MMLLHFCCALSRHNSAFQTLSSLFSRIISLYSLLSHFPSDPFHPPLLGKDEVGSSNLPSSSKKHPVSSRNRVFFMSKSSNKICLLHFCFFFNGKGSAAPVSQCRFFLTRFSAVSVPSVELCQPGRGSFCRPGKCTPRFSPRPFRKSFRR